MSRVFVNSSDHLDNAFPPVSVVPLSLGCWVKHSDLTTLGVFFSIGTTGTAFQRYSINTSPANQYVAGEADATVVTGATLPFGPQDTFNWHLVVGTFVDNTTRWCYYDGGRLISEVFTHSPPASGLNMVRAGSFGDTARPLFGKLAHMAVWNVVLTDAEVMRLMRVPPNAVRPDALLEYWPLTGNQSPEPSFGSIGNALTVTGTTFSTDNPTFPDVPMVGESADYF